MSERAKLSAHEAAAQCLFCETTLDRATKPEHILLNALGGRKTTTRATCSDCNNQFGNTIDKAIADQVSILRNMFQLPSGTGSAPPQVRSLPSEKGPIDLKADGAPDLKFKPFTVISRSDGTADIALNLRSLDELLRWVPHIAAVLGTTENKLWRQLQGVQGKRIITPAPRARIQFSLGGEDPLRSIVKSCLVLLSTVTGTELLRMPPFAEARRFVQEGGMDFNISRCSLDARLLPEAVDEVLSRDYGPLFNLIYVKSNDRGQTIGYFVLYRMSAWQVVLAESGGPKNVEAALISNPENPVIWADQLQGACLEFDWLKQPDGAGFPEVTNQRMAEAFDHYISKGRSRETGRIVEEVLCKHYADGDLIEDDERSRLAFSELSRRVAYWQLGVPYEESVTISGPTDSLPPEKL